MQPNNSITLIVGKTNVKFTKNEQELFDIFLEEYNDIFPNILNLSEKAIFDRIILNVSTLLGQQNYNSYSKITIAKIQSTLKSQYYMKDLISIKQIRNIFISMNSKNELNKFPPLEKKEIIPHNKHNINYIIIFFFKNNKITFFNLIIYNQSKTIYYLINIYK